MTGWILLLTGLLADGPADSATVAHQELANHWQVDVTLENHSEPAPHQQTIELDLAFHLTSPAGTIHRDLYQRLDESGSAFDLSAQASQVHPVWMGFSGDTFLAAYENAASLNIAAFPAASATGQTSTHLDLGTIKDLGVDGLEPTFATTTGSLKSGDLILSIPSAGGKHRAATMLRWQIDHTKDGNLAAHSLTPDAPLPVGVIGDITQMRLAEQQQELSDTNSSRQELFTQTLSDQWDLSARLLSRLTGTSDVGNRFSVDLVLEMKPNDGGPGKSLATTVTTVANASQPGIVDLRPLAAGLDQNRLVLLYECSFEEIHLFIWDPTSTDPTIACRDIQLGTLHDLQADQFDWGLGRIEGSLAGDGLTITFGIIHPSEAMPVPVRFVVKKKGQSNEFSIQRHL